MKLVARAVTVHAPRCNLVFTATLKAIIEFERIAYIEAGSNFGNTYF